MTVRAFHLGRVVCGLVVVGLVVGALSVEVVTRSEVSRARRVLPDALTRVAAPDDAGRAAAESLAAARRHLRLGAPARVAHDLEAIVADHPTAALHHVTSLAYYAAGDDQAAGHHAQLAARLAPQDADLAAAATRAVNVALAWRARSITRPLGLLAALALVALVLSAGARAHQRRRFEDYLDAVRGRVVFLADGEAFPSAVTLDGRTEALALDVFLHGRHGLACPRRPRRRPTLHVAFSHAASSTTLRLRPLRKLTDTAVRLPLRRETLGAILAKDGRWRLHVRLGPRTIAHAEVLVATAMRDGKRRHAQRHAVARA